MRREKELSECRRDLYVVTRRRVGSGIVTSCECAPGNPNAALKSQFAIRFQFLGERSSHNTFDSIFLYVKLEQVD